MSPVCPRPVPLGERLALHTWTLDTTPLPDALRAARAAGWPAVELRRIDFARAAEAGQSADSVLDLVRASGLAVACVGGQLGWMFADGEERAPAPRSDGRVLPVGARPRRVDGHEPRRPWAKATWPAPRPRSARSATSAPAHGVRIALEPPSQAAQLNSVDRLREVIARANHPSCGLLLDAYHLHRGGGGLRAVEDLDASEIAYVQFSDVPASGLQPGQTLDRLPPGQGVVPFREFFRLVADTGYPGHCSYEAPNPAAWARDPETVAREALAATRAVLPGGSARRRARRPHLT